VQYVNPAFRRFTGFDGNLPSAVSQGLLYELFHLSEVEDGEIIEVMMMGLICMEIDIWTAHEKEGRQWRRRSIRMGSSLCESSTSKTSPSSDLLPSHTPIIKLILYQLRVWEGSSAVKTRMHYTSGQDMYVEGTICTTVKKDLLNLPILFYCIFLPSPSSIRKSSLKETME
jgi:hypothetical protein